MLEICLLSIAKKNSGKYINRWQFRSAYSFPAWKIQITAAFLSGPMSHSCSVTFKQRTTTVLPSVEKLQWFSFASKSSRLILESSLHAFSFSHFACLLACEGICCLPQELKWKETSPKAPSPVRNTGGRPSGPHVPHTATCLPPCRSRNHMAQRHMAQMC